MRRHKPDTDREQIATHDSLMKLLPVGTVLQSQNRDCRYHGWFCVALGGYATIDVARFICDGKELYFSLDIADKQFGLAAMLARVQSEPFGALSKDMQQFVVNYFSNQEGAAK